MTVGKNTNKSKNPKKNYPEIDFIRLKEIASDWSKKYPCIEQITFYPHDPESFGEGKKYLIDIILDKRPVKNQIKDMESLISSHELLDAQNKDNSFGKKDWHIYFRFRGNVPPTHRILDSDQNVLLFKKPDKSIPMREHLRMLGVTHDSFVVVPKRDKEKEHAVWKKYIQPIVDLYYNDIFQYEFFTEPSVISSKDMEIMLTRTMRLCYRENDIIFPTDVFEIEVMKRLKAGQTKYKTINLQELFYTFLDTLFQEKTLPIFLEHLNHNYSEGIWPEKKSEQHLEDNNDSNQLQELQEKSEQDENRLSTLVKPSDLNKNKSVDYSSKTRSEKTELAKRWKEEGKTRLEIAKKLFPKDFENGFIKKSSLMKRVDRLK